MESKIENIKVKEIKNIAKITAQGFINDDFYSQYQKAGKKGLRKLNKLFREGILNCVKRGFAKKIVIGKDIAGCLLGFYYNRLKNYDNRTFNEFFVDNYFSNQTKQANKIKNQLDEFAKFNNDCIYLMTVVIDEKFRGQKLGQNLIQDFLNEYPTNQIIVDTTNPIMIHILEKLGFNRQKEIDGTIFLQKEIEIKTKKEFFCDVTTLIACTYNKDKINEIINNQYSIKTDVVSSTLISKLNERTYNEFETYYEHSRENLIYSRVKRFCLGQIEVCVGETYKKASLILSTDTQSNLAVIELTVCDLENQDVLLQYLDDSSRGNVNVLLKDLQKTNLYSYILSKFSLSKSGNAKSLITMAGSSKKYSKSFLSSVLLAETPEDLGQVVDEDVCSMLNRKNGLSQYSYADVYMSEKVVLQISDTFDIPLAERVNIESIPIQLMEMVCFEECAIVYADNSIRKQLTELNKKSSQSLLKQYTILLEQYAQTIDFWNIQTSYSSTRASINNMRKYFRIEELLDRYNRDVETYQKIYDSKCNYANNIESALLTSIGAILTTISVLELVFNLAGYVKLAIAGVIVGLLLIVKNRLLFRNKKKNKFK